MNEFQLNKYNTIEEWIKDHSYKDELAFVNHLVVMPKNQIVMILIIDGIKALRC